MLHAEVMATSSTGSFSKPLQSMHGAVSMTSEGEGDGFGAIPIHTRPLHPVAKAIHDETALDT